MHKDINLVTTRPPAHFVEGLFITALIIAVFAIGLVLIPPWPETDFPMRRDMIGEGVKYFFGIHRGYQLTDDGRQWLTETLRVGALIGALPAIMAGWAVGKAHSGIVHLAGREISTSMSDLKAEWRRECKRSGRGVEWLSGLFLAATREVRTIAICGSTGAGKTIAILHLLSAIMRAESRVLIYDVKGDYTKYFPGAVLFAPWFRGTSCWDVGADCRGFAQARDLAERLIPESHEPIWSATARQVLTALISECQETKGTAWTFADVAALWVGEDEALKEMVCFHVPEARRNLDELKERSAKSILLSLGGHLSNVFDLAMFWRNVPQQNRFSFRRWLHEQGAEKTMKTLILQRHGNYKLLSTHYIQSAISCIAGYVADPAFSDSRTRRIWFVFDEFPTLEKSDALNSLVTMGRSKGCCTVLGFQNMAQIRNVYGPDMAESWASIAGTYIIGRTQGVETPQWLSRLLGKRRVKIYDPQFSRNFGQGQSGRSISKSENWKTEEMDLMRPETFSEELGEVKSGVKMLVWSGGRIVYKVVFPFSRLKTSERTFVEVDPRRQDRPRPRVESRGAAAMNQKQPDWTAEDLALVTEMQRSLERGKE